MSDSDLSVGWIGAGRMGAAMAVRLARAGVKPRVWNRTRAKAEAIADQGCGVADTIADLRDSDVVFTMVSTPADLEQVLLGEGGLLVDPAHLPGAVVDCSTVSIESSERIRAECAAAGVDFLAAPVSGNGKVVAAGRLTFVVSGPKQTYDKVAHLLGHIGKSVTYVGEGDAARLAKICHNLMLGVVAQTMAEITVLAEKGGMSRAAFLEFLNDSVMGSTFTRYKSPAYVHLDYTPTFTPVLLRKDFDLGLAAARELDVPMPVAAVDRAAGAGDGQRRPGRRGLRGAARPAGRGVRPGADAGGHAGRRRARRGTEVTASTARPLAAPGHMGVDYETRVDFDRLREHRLARAQAVAGGQRLRRVPAVRLLQHPLHHADLDRRRARRQDDPLRAADPGRRSHAVGLRLGRQAPQALLALAGRRTTAGPACSACAGRSRRPRG